MNTERDPSLPDDIEALRAFALTTASELDEVVAERDRLLGVVERLEHLVREFQRARFGKKSEKLDPDQLKLGKRFIGTLAMTA